MNQMQYYWKNKEGRAKVAASHTDDMERDYAPQIKNSSQATKQYMENSMILIKPYIHENMDIILCNLDSVSAIFEHEQGKTAVLNFASFKSPGGGFMAGSRAQEECLCHNSFLYNVLVRHQDYYDYNNANPKNNALYFNRALYSPDVYFFNEDTELSCDVITCAAPNITPAKKYGWKVTDEDNSAALDSRINFILKIAVENNVETLILGAYGCGVFGQDATEVARIFMKYLHGDYNRLFKKVVFAIPQGINDYNYEKFESVLEEYE